MITVKCTCGQQYQIENEAVADQFGCPQCGIAAADVLTAAQPQFQIYCSTHPDQPATHNCLHCAKPLCMECVSANGYYCSATCKAAVAAAEPDAVSPDQEKLAGVGAEIEQQMERAGKIGRKLGLVVLIAGALVALWFVGRWILAPKGKIITSLPVSSQVARFRFLPAGPGQVLVQDNDELSLIRIPGLVKTWAVPLTQWRSPDDEAPLNLKQVQDDVIVLHSHRQVVALAKPTGQLQWQKSAPNQFRDDTIVHPAGIWAAGANLSLVTGEPTYTITNAARARSAIAGGRLALLTVAAHDREETDDDLTAGSIHNIDVKGILAQAQGKKRRPRESRRPHQLQIFSVTDGRLLGEKTIRVPYDVKLQPVGHALAVVSDTELQLYREQAEPVWTVALPAEPEHIDVHAGLLLVATESGVVAFDAQTGVARWRRPGLRATAARIGPDGAVYVTVTMKKDEVKAGEAANFRVAGVKVGVSGATTAYRVLLRLDPQSGQTLWGVRNIGDEVLFDGDQLFVVDRVHDMNLLADQIMVGSYSVRQLAPRTGEDLWEFLKAGDLYHCTVVDGHVVAVTSSDPPTGRSNPTCPYELVVIAGQ
ncbi:MAG: hypothetical protein PCFJNLEI_01478 [Verrucomicrobiae bacterium]|nr:hypothetical protein [Verrucomicrobiae bacterium]